MRAAAEDGKGNDNFSGQEEKVKTDRTKTGIDAAKEGEVNEGKIKKAGSGGRGGRKVAKTGLRRKAEALVKKRFAATEIDGHSLNELQRLLHELRTHQIELELQNEELRYAELSLYNAKSRYADLYDFAPVGYFTFDQNGSVIDVNLTGCTMLGVARARLLKVPFMRFVSKEYQDTFYIHRRKVLDTGEVQSCELEIKRKDGAVFYAALESVLSEGKLCRTVMSDITARSNAEAALKKSEEKYRSIFEGASDGIIACDLETGKFLFANRQFSQLTGYSEDEVLKLRLKDLYSEKDLPYVLDEAMAAGNVTETRDIPVLKKDNSVIYCDIGRSRLNETTLLGFFRDVTERRQAEEALHKANAELETRVAQRTAELVRVNDELEKQISERISAQQETLKLNAELEQRVKDRTAELESVNKELEVFSYTVSHDLKAPLRSIEGFTKAILEDYADKFDETAQDYFHRILAAGRRMSQLIEALLSMARLTGRELKENLVNLSSLVEIAVHDLRKKQPEREIEFIIPKGIKAKGDREMLETVVENLLDNAWKFTWKHPSARIEFGTIEGNAEQVEHGKTVYFVRDNGAGFDMAYADKLFKPFQRLHSESEFPGIGIGLAIVQKILEKHGGKIWAEGEVEKGATFYFTL